MYLLTFLHFTLCHYNANSSDGDKKSFNGYYSDMPWFALEYEQTSIKQQLSIQIYIYMYVYIYLYIVIIYY